MEVQPQLIKDCINRDRRAEYLLYKIIYSYLMSICIRYAKHEDAAKESLNIGYLKILNNLHKYDLNSPFKPWIRRIIINTLIDESRKSKAHHSVVKYVDEYYDSEQQVEINKALDKINVEQIYALISVLPPATKEVFNLFVIDSYSHKEIAELLGMSEGTSKWHLNAARQKLKSMLEPNEVLTNVQ